MSVYTYNIGSDIRCDCLPGWFGLHCTQKTSICNTENSEALCGEHGVCVAKSSSSLGYTCICDQVCSIFFYFKCWFQIVQLYQKHETYAWIAFVACL